MALQNNVLFLVGLLCAVLFSTTCAVASRQAYYMRNIAMLEKAASEGGLVECWNALTELKSCTSEIVLFFMNGQTNIGPDCCKAIGIITRNCWPNMLTSIGFTVEEGNILRSYCNASSSPASAPRPGYILENY